MGTKFYKAKIAYCLESGRVGTIKLFFVFVIFLSGPLSVVSQTNLSFTTITTDFPAPGKGAQNWGEHNWDDIYQPTIPSGNSVAKNYYTRFNWLDIESNTVQGSYSWTVVDAFIQQAMASGAMFSFGIMNICDGCGTGGLIPTYLHNLMQAEPVQDWFYSPDGVWIPNYNSPSFITRYAALMRAVANHIATTSYNGHTYTSAFLGYDIRSYGAFGEGHTFPWGGSEPNNNVIATDASLIRLIDSAIAIFPNVQLTVPMNYEAPITSEYGINGNPGVQTAYKLLTSSNNYGRIGWRRDNIGDDGYNSYITANTGSYNPGSGNVSFNSLLVNNWQVAPIGGEPAFDGGALTRSGPAMYDMHNEDVTFHMSYFGNGNYPFYSASGADWTNMVANVRAASAEEGYKLILKSGTMTTTLTSGGPFNITLNWQNIGLAPVYEKWNVTFELRKSDGTVVWTGNSAFNPRLFLPQPAATAASDNFNLTSVAAGTYSMFLIIRDPASYKQPLPLAISGRNADGSYLLRSNITIGTGPANQPPTANAGADQTIQLPVSNTSFTGTGTDADGTIASYAWAKLSGPAGGTISTPATANTNISGLIQGVYRYTLTVTDNQGATGIDTVQVTVNAATGPVQPPVVNAGSDQTIQMPTASVSLSGSATDPSGIASYAWTKMSGPGGTSMTAPSSPSTNVTGLVQGTYKFVLTATDNLGTKASDTVQVTVNAAAPANQPPVANAGADKTIQLPVSTVSFTGSGTDPDGTVASYAWAKISGPTGGAISTPATANTIITGLIQGIYSYSLTVTDNLGAKDADTVLVTVNPAAPPANQPPIAKAGSDQTITLPVNSGVLNGTASSDPDGSITAFLWTKISGPSQFTIGNTNSASTVANNLTAGSYSFQLKVTDNVGATALDTVKITVIAAPVDQPPVANAGADITITLPTNLTNLVGTASADPDGTITAYAWSQVSGPGTSSIASSTSASTAVSGLQQGTYLFALKVTDNNGVSDFDSVRVTVNPAANVPPIANAGTSKSITLPVNSTNLDGSLSSDPDGSIVSYAWAQISGPSTATLTNGNSALASVANMLAGQYTFELTVTDNSGAVSKAGVKISVIPAGPQPPDANAGADQTIRLPNNSVTINGSASSAPSGNIVSYIWTEKSGPSSVSLSNTTQNTIGSLKAGVYVFSLVVTDNNGLSGTDSVIITVLPAANLAPIANAGPSISLTLPNNSTTLDGSNSSDPDGTITAYSWTEISGPGTPTASGANTAVLSLSALQVGQYTYQLTVTDNNGASSSAQVKVRVAAAPNVLPVANAGADQTITSPANSVILNGSASYDPDGTIKSYNWVTVSGPGSITISNSNTATPSVTGLQVGQYIMELTVTDNSGAVAKSQVVITVLPKAVLPNQSPVANAGSNLTITAPLNSISLNGTSSFDPDGTITAFSWTQISGPSTAVISAGNTSTASVSQLVVGQYVFQLKVTDNNGATGTDQVTVTVNPPVPKLNLAPVADAGQSDTISLPTNTYTLNGSLSTDPDGTIESYQWQQIGGPNTVTSSSMNSAQVSIGDLQAGDYEFQVTVTDNEGATSISTMTLTVLPISNSIVRDQLIIYPNPAHDVVNGKVISGVTGRVKIHVYDMNGKLVYEAEIEKSDDSIIKTMNISSLASGMYTIQINIANRKTMVAKFIKD